jgi:transcriptional regulator with XRE-family HTH domain
MSDKNITVEVGERLREARAARGLTLRQLAEATTYAETTISGVENGQHKPSERFLRDMVMAMGLNIHWLMVGHGEMFDIAAAGNSKVLIFDHLESLRAETVELQDELSLAAARVKFIGARIDDIEQLVGGQVKPILDGKIIPDAKTLVLTSDDQKLTSGDMQPVLSKLMQRLRSATAVRGQKVALANELGVHRQCVTDWLSGRKEPGGKITLRLLRWVESWEQKQKSK